ncbi:hypothetical protein FRC12_020524 [Ceratobasidium sp. 428]|nr:hypothetical protein FRC12_020524 [Ceratobasidium sp. 428]
MGEGNRSPKNGETQVSWNKAKAAAFVKEVEELQEAIKYCDSSAFIDGLSDSLDHASMGTVQLVKEIVSPLIFDGYTDSRHCVRCHKEYTEQENDDTACVFRCTGGGHPFTVKGAIKQSYYMMECCGRVFKEVDSWDYSNVICIEARHTDDPDKVKYFNPTREHSVYEESKTAIPLGSNNPKVVTCAIKGCGKQDPHQYIGYSGSLLEADANPKHCYLEDDYEMASHLNEGYDFILWSILTAAVKRSRKFEDVDEELVCFPLPEHTTDLKVVRYSVHDLQSEEKGQGTGAGT